MNSRQLQYAVVLSESLNISEAAKRLNISQPALSKQILALEKELGVVLFDRDSSPLSLTSAGERFIICAKELLFKEENLHRLMEDFKDNEKGRLVIGISPFRALYFVSGIIKKLQEKYKGLNIVLKEEGSAKLHKDAAEGAVDFAIVNLPVDTALLDVVPLKSEPIVLVVPKQFSNDICAASQKGSPYPVVSLEKCGDIPFIALGKNQELRKLLDKLCITGGFAPNITTEVVGITTAWSFASAGIGATVLPLRFIEGNQANENVQIFSLLDSSTERQPAIITRKGQHISKYAKEAIELIKSM